MNLNIHIFCPQPSADFAAQKNNQLLWFFTVISNPGQKMSCGNRSCLNQEASFSIASAPILQDENTGNSLFILWDPVIYFVTLDAPQ